jgi:NTE family protein
MPLSGKHIGLCLSGGGARGFAHLGVLQAVDELKIPISRLSGSSAGAMAAVFYAYGYTPQKSLEIVLERKFWQYVSVRPSKWGLLSLSKTAGILKKYLPEDDFSSLKKKVTVCATNISRGVPQYFSEGEIIRPTLASCCVPFFFKPITIGGSKFVDGGLTNNLPLEPLGECDIKISVNITPFEKRLPVRSLRDVILKSVYISLDHQTALKSEKADLNIVPEGILHFDGFSMKNAERIFEAGYRSTMESLKSFDFGEKYNR